MYAVDPEAAGCVNIGDLTMSGSHSVWDTHHQTLANAAPDPSVPEDPLGIVRQSRFRTDVDQWGDYIRYLGVTGNHDLTSWDFWYENWNKYLKGQKELGVNIENGGIYYTVSFNQTLLIMLDSERPSDAQTEWLEQVLKSPKAQNAFWKMVFFHQPVYPCNGKWPFGYGLRWVQLFEQYEVDIAFVAHSHTYERTCPMRDGRCVLPRGEHGVVYLNTSGGGGPIRDVWPDKIDTVTSGDISDTYDCAEVLEVYRSYWWHFCHVKVDDCILEVQCYPHDEHLRWGADQPEEADTDTDTAYLAPLVIDKCDDQGAPPLSTGSI
jgi:hypothetical protein